MLSSFMGGGLRLLAFFHAYPESLPLTVNLLMLMNAAYVHEWGKATYWLGATILTLGILLMKG